MVRERKASMKVFGTTAKYNIGQYLSKRVHHLMRGRCSFVVSGMFGGGGELSKPDYEIQPGSYT